MKEYIMKVHGFQESNITVLMDDGKHTSPTRANIMAAYKQLTMAAQAGDAVFCHYSGKTTLQWHIFSKSPNNFIANI
jgi:hypothetical protein